MKNFYLQGQSNIIMRIENCFENRKIKHIDFEKTSFSQNFKKHDKNA